jgi:hypothetical protein
VQKGQQVAPISIFGYLVLPQQKACFRSPGVKR